MKTAIIKYNAGNVQSVMYALDRLGASYVYTDDETEIRTADRVIFPGVGEAGTAMAYLKKHGLDKIIPALTQPVLGTCVGMQLMCAHSEESNTTCMGIFDVNVIRFPSQPGMKVPHTGWNNIYDLSTPITNGLPENSYMYFVHSYAAPVNDLTLATTSYGDPFAAVVHRGNVYGAQFHPERSARIGAQLLRNFVQL